MQIHNPHHHPRPSSNNRLPQIAKKSNLKSKENPIKSDFSLHLVKTSKKQNLNSKQNENHSKSIKSYKATPLRIRTDSASDSLQKISRNQSFAIDEEKLDNFDVTINNFSKNVETFHQEIRRRAQTKTKDKNSQNIDIFGKTRNNYERKRVMTENDDIFKEIRQIIQNKLPSQQENTSIKMSQIKNMLKIAKLHKNIKELIPEASISELKRSFEKPLCSSSSYSPSKNLKDEQNYSEWRRIELDLSSPSPRYSESTYEIESERLCSFVKRNEESLGKYLKYKEELSGLNLEMSDNEMRRVSERKG